MGSVPQCIVKETRRETNHHKRIDSRIMWGRWDFETDLGAGNRTDLPQFSINNTGQKGEGIDVLVSYFISVPVSQGILREIDRAIETKLRPEIVRILDRYFADVGVG
jgi:hypothetical protein